jgi:hypothetical protein
MIDPKQLPNDPDAWVKPDISQPRTTAEFINDTWRSRKSPVYSLRPLEVSVLQSMTLKGWLWRAIVGIIRHKKISKWLPCEDKPDPTFPPLGNFVDSEGEKTMSHYIAITEKFHPITAAPPLPSPERPNDNSYSCTCLGDAAAPKKPRKKPRKKTAKKTTRKLKKR